MWETSTTFKDKNCFYGHDKYYTFYAVCLPYACILKIKDRKSDIDNLTIKSEIPFLLLSIQVELQVWKNEPPVIFSKHAPRQLLSLTI